MRIKVTFSAAPGYRRWYVIGRALAVFFAFFWMFDGRLVLSLVNLALALYAHFELYLIGLWSIDNPPAASPEPDNG